MIRRQMEFLNEINEMCEEEDKGDPRGDRIVDEFNRWLREGSRDDGSAFVLDETLSGAEGLAVVGMIGREGGVRAASRERTPEGLLDYGKIAGVMEDWKMALQTRTHELYKEKFDDTPFNEAEGLEANPFAEHRIRGQVQGVASDEATTTFGQGTGGARSTQG